MSSTTKPHKEKPQGGTPRLVPRPTAASAARAARNATNRNLLFPHRQSPARSSSTTPSKTKSPLPRIPATAAASVSDLEVIKRPEPATDPVDVVMQQAVDVYEVIDNTTVVVTYEMSNEVADNNNNAHLHENYVETKHNVEDSVTICNKSPNPEELELQKDYRTDRSRSQTAASSRPETPKSLPSSRPQTPRGHTRPDPTPHPRYGTPVSRPSTPQRSTTRPTTPRSPQPNARPSTPVPQCLNEDDDDIKTVFTIKQRQFHQMKKELDLKQQAILQVFETLRSLRDRMCREGLAGAGEGFLQELVMFNVGDWTSEEVAQLCRDAAASSIDGAIELIDSTVPIDQCALQELEAKVVDVPASFADLCLQAYTGRQEVIDWVKELIEYNALKDCLDGSGECLERISRYNAQGLELCDALRELKNRADDAVLTVSQVSRRACQERSALVAVGESLVREVARLRQDIAVRVADMTEMREVQADTDVSKELEEARRDLEEERTARVVTKDKLATSESQLRQLRFRVTKMDRQLRESENSITSLTATVKSLEDQSRQKETQLEARARKLKESLKTGEMTSGHLAQQRDALQNEISNLKEQIENLTTQHKSAIQELTSQLKASKAIYEEQRKINWKEVELKESVEAALVESQNIIVNLKTKITELENSKPNPDLPTEREMDLWAELQATKDTLHVTEEEVNACKREKIRFLETLTKIAESENKVGMQQKLAAELLNKEEIMGKMQIQIRELTKSIKLNEQKVIQYEQYVRGLLSHNRAVGACLESQDGISYEELQQEIINLKMNLLESVHRNEELIEMLVQKEQQIEQQDKNSRAQARVIKVREELINMLKNKESEQGRELTALQQDLEHRMKIVDEVNKQIAAKAEEIQELFGTLENKQQQIHRLEKIVLALEEQQRRAQAQRIRHEEKIAALEHELAAGGNRRERKFLFF